MECRKCLQENDFLLKEKGHGYGYIGQEYNCKRHNNDNKQNNILKWTDGKPYERSRRMSHQIKLESEEFSKTQEQSAYTSSLNHDENTWEILNQTLSGTGFKVSNRREELGNKLSNRELVQQIGFNPFLNHNNSNYLDDISIRDQYLKPINTTQGEKKQNNNNNNSDYNN